MIKQLIKLANDLEKSNNFSAAEEVSELIATTDALNKLEQIKGGSGKFGVLLRDIGFKVNSYWRDSPQEQIRDNFNKKSVLVDLATDNLTATQDTVSYFSVKYFIKNPIKINEKPIDVVKDGNEYYLLDGHHRASAAKLLGLPIKARLLDLTTI